MGRNWLYGTKLYNKNNHPISWNHLISASQEGNISDGHLYMENYHMPREALFLDNWTKMNVGPAMRAIDIKTIEALKEFANKNDHFDFQGTIEYLEFLNELFSPWLSDAAW